MKRVACAALLFAACGSSKPAMPQDAHLPASDAPAPAHVVAYISGYGPSIAWFDFDPATGTLTPVSSIATAQPQPSFLAMTSTHLYAVSESASRVGAYAIDPATGALTFINDVASGGDGPAHVSVDRAGKYALVANYGGGTVAVLPIRVDGGLDAARQTLAPGTNAHMIASSPCPRADQYA